MIHFSSGAQQNALTGWPRFHFRKGLASEVNAFIWLYYVILCYIARYTSRRTGNRARKNTFFFFKWVWHCWRNANFVSDNLPKKSKKWIPTFGGFSRFTTVPAHFQYFHRRVFVKSEVNSIFFRSENAFQCFNCLLLQVGTAIYAVPPLPRPGVQLQVV